MRLVNLAMMQISRWGTCWSVDGFSEDRDCLDSLCPDDGKAMANSSRTLYVIIDNNILTQFNFNDFLAMVVYFLVISAVAWRRDNRHLIGL